MLDINNIRKDPTTLVDQLQRRGFQFDLERFQKLDSERKTLLERVETLRAKQNLLADAFAKAKRANEPTDLLRLTDNEVAELTQAEIACGGIEEAIRTMLLSVPNVLHATTPNGEDEKHNVVMRTWGEVPTFTFAPKDHVALGARKTGHLGVALDAEAGATLAGSRFTVLRGNIAKLHRALVQYMVNTHTDKHEYEETYVPYLVLPKAMEGTGQFPKFKEDAFGVVRGFDVEEGGSAELLLIPTAEVPLTNMLRETTLPYPGQPLKFVAHTPCFRAEAGSAGRDVKGMIRQHQFDKVELVWFVKPEDADRAFIQLQEHAEAILTGLNLPYRAVALCAGDTGFGASRTVDLEVWLPGQNAYREISSCSHFGDFQARRMGAKFKEGKNKAQFWHTLNGSALAVGRTLIAVLENYQMENGDIEVPYVLQPYMGCDIIKMS